MAATGCCAERWTRPGGRLPLAAAAACLAALASTPLTLAVTGGAALMLALPDRQNASRGCLRALLFTAACSPGQVWLAELAAFACCCAEGRRRTDFTVAPLIEAACGILVLCRTVLRPDSVVSPAMTVVLLAGSAGLLLLRLLRVMVTPRLSDMMAGLALLPAWLTLIALGLQMLATLNGSALAAHTASDALALTLVTLWPVAAAFLHTGGLVTQGAGSDRLARLGGLVLFAPRLAALLAAALAVLVLLPPAGGFSVLWLLVETILGLLPEGFAAVLPLLLLLCGLGVAVALGCLAALRMAALLFLGNARSPRMAACQDCSGKALFPAVAAFGLAVFAALVPGGVLRLASRALAQLPGSVSAPGGPLFTLVAPDGLSVWTPAGVTLLLAGLLLVVRLLVVRAGRAPVPAPRDVPSGILPGVSVGETNPWLGGLVTRTPLLPFGEPHIWSGADMAASAAREILLPESWRTRPLFFGEKRFPPRRVTRFLLRFLRGTLRFGNGRMTRDQAEYGVAVVLLLAAILLCVMTVMP